MHFSPTTKAIIFAFYQIIRGAEKTTHIIGGIDKLHLFFLFVRKEVLHAREQISERLN